MSGDARRPSAAGTARRHVAEPDLDRAGDRGGFILVAVLVVLALLSGLVGAMSLVVRGAVEKAGLDAGRIAADGLIDAGVELAAYQLFALKRPVAEVDRQQIRFDDGVVRLGVSAEDGRININLADEALLAGAWTAAALGPLPANTFADRVIDWRDADADVRPNGAEADAYGASLPPANRPFRSVAELGLVLGVTAQAASTLAPILTVSSGVRTVNPLNASPAVLNAVPGMSEATTGRIVALRQLGTDAARKSIDDVTSSLRDFIATTPSAAYRVRVEVRRDDQVVAQADVTIIRGVSPGAVYNTVGWSR